MSYKIGIDFDNTIIDYGALIYHLALDKGWVAPETEHTKDAVKSALLTADNHDLRWQALQAQAYGAEIVRAQVFAGFAEFLRFATSLGHQVFIISQKTKFSNYDRSVPLRMWAHQWIERQQFSLPIENVFFESTREEKIGRIAQIGCDIFIDDLAEVLMHPDFPRGVRRIWFNQGGKAREQLIRLESWKEILSFVKGLNAG